MNNHCKEFYPLIIGRKVSLKSIWVIKFIYSLDTAVKKKKIKPAACSVVKLQ